jgi:hypothetical protein
MRDLSAAGEGLRLRLRPSPASKTPRKGGDCLLREHEIVYTIKAGYNPNSGTPRGGQYP